MYELFRRRQRAGVWRRMLTALQARADAAGSIVWDVSVDSTVMRAHQHAAGARKKGISRSNRPTPTRAGPSPTTTGRGGRGWTSKLHLACEQRRRPLSLLVTAGQRGDSRQFTTVIERISVPPLGPSRARTRPDRVLADKAYS
ncbi:transposase [Actinosynnema sp. NPDC047251]|uniref:transposase n=1 Tax=Saccharothrix espanaensis TaxID=103731 RepID=UPI00031DE001|nr:transposase [Saccharothrix espanaensis]